MQTDGFHLFQKELGATLKRHRKERGLSQEQAGDALGMDRVSIGYIEQGVRAPRLSTLYGLSRLYGVRLPELFAFDMQGEKEKGDCATAADNEPSLERL